MNTDRREFLHMGIGAAALGLWPQASQAAKAWSQGEVVHLLPTANHNRFLIKASFKTALKSRPRLLVNGKAHEGVQTDPLGRFWRFDVQGLSAATRYELRITDRQGRALCDAWPLKTFPAPDAQPERMRI